MYVCVRVCVCVCECTWEMVACSSFLRIALSGLLRSCFFSCLALLLS
jgi:hypothetical protein